MIDAVDIRKKCVVQVEKGAERLTFVFVFLNIWKF